MNQYQAINKRKSVREYSKKPLKGEKLAFLQKHLTKPYPVENEEQVELVFLEDGPRLAKALQGMAGYEGVMIEAPHYLGVYVDRQAQAYRSAGYFAEYILFHAMEYNIGSCWIHVNDEAGARQAVGHETDKSLLALIAIGEPLEENAIAKFFQNLKTNKASVYSEGGYGNLDVDYRKNESNRVPTTSIVYVEKWGEEMTFEELHERNLTEIYSLMKNAPSWGNRQPWKFIIDHDDVILAIEKNPRGDELSDNLEGGIAMFYFALAMNQRGIPGKWSTRPSIKDYMVPDNYILIGTFRIQ